MKGSCPGPSAQVHPGDLACTSPRGGSQALRGEVHSEEVRTSPEGRSSPRPLSQNPGHRAEGAPLRVPDARAQSPPALASMGFPFRATGAGRDQSPVPLGCPLGATRERQGMHVSTEGGVRGALFAVPRPPQRPHVGAAGSGGNPCEAPPREPVSAWRGRGRAEAPPSGRSPSGEV
ncbi:PREDICTED: uncharacterized protein LOC109380239 [Hipposideros armiger]|uniref:Uncharacterized protein LOC109380239 n=1 Tax=Hipposideros armiger TaxID=186990 RepID=A0A8B7QWT4_HIPAR|nr:PREDICTED: uncharacterized protein LOC109380239 [Hipposideros armiger]